MTGTSMNRRRWQNFRRNRRAYVSLIVFCACFALSLFAELLANDRPILVKYRDGYYMPIFQFYSEQTFGGDLRTEAIYGDVEVQCLIVTGGLDACWDTPELLMEDAGDGTIGDQPAETGWIVWPLIPYHHSTISTLDGSRSGRRRTWPALRPTAMPDLCLASFGMVAVVCRRCRRVAQQP